MNISKAFADFPNEAAFIARMLAGYTDLEIDLMNCVKASQGGLDTVLKAMYRTRGESLRVGIADAFGRQAYRALGLGAQFEEALAAVHHCRKIRNQYAHCTWWNDYSGTLAFTNLEDLAQLNEQVEDLREINVRHVTLAHLEVQFGYFEFTSNKLIWVLHEGNKKTGKPALPNLEWPAHQQPPALYIA